MLEFILNNIYFLISAIIAVIACIFLARRGQIAKIKEIILALCVDAELTYGSGTGQIKKSSVLEALYGLLPSWAKLIFPACELEKFVEEGKKRMDALIDENEKIKELLGCPKTEAPSVNPKPAAAVRVTTKLASRNKNKTT